LAKSPRDLDFRNPPNSLVERTLNPICIRILFKNDGAGTDTHLANFSTAIASVSFPEVDAVVWRQPMFQDARVRRPSARRHEVRCGADSQPRQAQAMTAPQSLPRVTMMVPFRKPKAEDHSQLEATAFS
jgi:hypothetical protein